MKDGQDEPTLALLCRTPTYFNSATTPLASTLQFNTSRVESCRSQCPDHGPLQWHRANKHKPQGCKRDHPALQTPIDSDCSQVTLREVDEGREISEIQCTSTRAQIFRQTGEAPNHQASVIGWFPVRWCNKRTPAWRIYSTNAHRTTT